MGNLVAYDAMGNAQVLDEELNLIWPGFL
uniref:Uncharacterized protein n=1 Tax=Vitis vinifera TaxID=29760 RepID=F6GSH0_VITVI